MRARIISVNGAEAGNHHGLSRILPPFLCAKIIGFIHCRVLYNITSYVYVISRNNIETIRVFYTQQMTSSTTIVIISKPGSLSECVVDTKIETTVGELTVLLSKKCGYRNHEGFSCCHTWKYRNKHAASAGAHRHIYVDIWAKSSGRAGQENKYELPPPLDEHLLFGNIALVARIDKENAIDMTIELWNKIYEALFGGFEDLVATAAEDENEVDELDSIPAYKKTSSGYLKDGFVVDDDTPRCKRNTRKSKSESTEGEFITETETETESDTPPTLDSDTDGSEPVAKIIAKPKRQAAVKKSAVGGKAKKTVEEPVLAQESESELSEDSYD
jgi:hypothetical protein